MSDLELCKDCGKRPQDPLSMYERCTSCSTVSGASICYVRVWPPISDGTSMFGPYISADEARMVGAAIVKNNPTPPREVEVLAVAAERVGA